MKKGFTLIEMIITLLLLVLLLFSLGILIPLSQIRMKNTSHQDIAVILAENIMSDIHCLTWNNISKNATFDSNKPVADPAIIENGIRIFPPEPYPIMHYQIYSGEYSQGKGTSYPIHEVNYKYVIKTLYDTTPAGVEIEDLLKISVSIYWDESRGHGGTRKDRFINLTSKLLRR